jgi:hypothetical protein
MSDEKLIEKEMADGKKVKILGETYEPGMPTAPDRWEDKLRNRAEIMKYLSGCERYFYGKEGYGSEKRKNPA